MAAILVVLAATALPARPAAASAPPMVGRLAVLLPDAVVMVMGSDGSSPVQLDAGRRSANAYTITWSPDGTRVAHPDWYLTDKAIAYGVNVFDVASGAKDVVWTPEAVVAPAWSRDGRRLAYITFDEVTGEMVVETSASGGCCRRRVLVGPDLEPRPRPEWSADGRFLHVIGRHVEGNDLAGAVLRVPVTGGPARRLFPGLDAWEVKVSPDGRHLAMCATGPAGDGVYVARSDATGLRLLAPLSCAGDDVDQLAWSPDGAALAVAAAGGLHRVDPRTGAATLLAPGGSTVSWSPDGGWLAFRSSAGAWVVGADGTGLARVPGTDGAWEVYFSPVA